MGCCKSKVADINDNKNAIEDMTPRSHINQLRKLKRRCSFPDYSNPKDNCNCAFQCEYIKPTVSRKKVITYRNSFPLFHGKKAQQFDFMSTYY